MARNLFDQQQQSIQPSETVGEKLCVFLKNIEHQLQFGFDSLELFSNATEISELHEPRLQPVFPFRNCPRCGDLVIDPETPLRIHCSPLTGIVSKMEITSAATAGAFRAKAVWASPLPAAGTRPLLRRQTSYGRGANQQEAEAGCIGEALERYSLVYQGNEAMVRGRFSDLNAIHPNEIMLFSQSQYIGRHEWNRCCSEEFLVTDPFDEDQVTDWLETHPLGSAPEGKLVAAASCLMWYPSESGVAQFARADTIGCGGGVTYEDALQHALLEWIERDAIAIWWENRIRRPAFRLEAFEWPELEGVARGIRATGRDLYLLDCTTDIGIPVYVSVAPLRDGSEILFAGAAHPSPRVAAMRAATEVGQPWFEAMRTGGSSSSFRDWIMHETLATQSFLVPLEFRNPPPESQSGHFWSVAYLVERLESVGLRTYAVDHSRPEVLTRVVRAVVPGMRHIWNRRAPGRLYDVPVKLGWISTPFDEADLNPVRCMI